MTEMAETAEGQRPGGEKVRIMAGPFKEFIGVLEGSGPDPRKVTVAVSLFGRPVRMQLDREQVVKI
jgi:transcription antitermination factor NusG